jgi:hypothetical protein
MDKVNYCDEYFLGNIDFETCIDKVSESIQDNVIYIMGAVHCAKYMYDYYGGREAIYPSEMAYILDKFLENVGLPEDIRQSVTLEDKEV